MFLTSWPTNNDDQNISCTDVHNELVYGFELSWLQRNCFLNGTNHIQCIRDFTEGGLLKRILYQLEEWYYGYNRQNRYWWNALVKNGEYTGEVSISKNLFEG
ncbi:hypothetical protein CFP56_004087 [Quercus suber]|uniref:Uncharacterized protein n=1 Tax=Quercus suber TaxID=58331 RepID=A0AAW0I5T1_QUESU